MVWVGNNFGEDPIPTPCLGHLPLDSKLHPSQPKHLGCALRAPVPSGNVGIPLVREFLGFQGDAEVARWTQPRRGFPGGPGARVSLGKRDIPCFSNQLEWFLGSNLIPDPKFHGNLSIGGVLKLFLDPHKNLT